MHIFEENIKLFQHNINRTRHHLEHEREEIKLKNKENKKTAPYSAFRVLVAIVAGEYSKHTFAIAHLRVTEPGIHLGTAR